MGGEPSGHVIFRHFATTGDGILGALKAIESMKFYNKSIKELAAEIELYPQVIKNTVVQNKVPLENVAPIQKVLKRVQEKLADKGRVLLRYSGTEPIARVMVEGENGQEVEDLCDQLIKAVSHELG